MPDAPASFLSDFQAASRGNSPESSAKSQLAVLQKWLFSDSLGMFKSLRKDAPIFVPDGPTPAIVSKFADVVEVAETDTVYSVRPYSGAMMRDNGGPNFILGMDDSADFDFNLSVLTLAIKRTDMKRIQEIVRHHATAQISAARSSGRLDLVDAYGRYVPLKLIGDYFGTPGPDLATLSKWTHDIFTDIFFNLGQDPAVVEAGSRAGKALADYVDGLIAEIKAGRGGPDDDSVLRRLLRMQGVAETRCTDQGVRVNLTGCINGITDNTVAGVVNVLDVLFSMPAALGGAIDAARSDRDDVLSTHVFEALRFAPAAPFLVRVALQDHTLAKGTPRETKIPAGKVVMAATCSAMMDETVLDDPGSFRLDRPLHQNLQFGKGMHSCIGKHISHVQLTELVKQVLLLKNVRRARGTDGNPKRNGPFPVSFAVEFDT